jgi:hypothetical protein
VIIYGPEISLSTTMKCVLTLCALHFGVLFLHFLGSFSGGEETDGLEGTALSAGVCISLTPLLSILFVACRMRALQLTNNEGNCHWWAQDAMKLGVLGIFLQVVCCILLPFFTSAATTVDGDGNAEYALKPLFGAYIVQMIKYVALGCLYGCVLAICASIVLMYEGMPDISHPKRGVRLITEILWGLMILGGAGLLSSAKVIGYVVKWAIEGLDESFLGVNIWVGKAALSLCRGYVFVQNLVVENPEGQQFASPALLKVGKVVVKVNLWRLIFTGGKEIEINTLILTGIEVNYEKEGLANSNVGTVIDFIQGTAPDAATAEQSDGAEQNAASSSDVVTAPAETATTGETPSPAAPATAEEGPQVELHRLQLKNISAAVWMSHMKLISVNLGDVEEKDFQEHYGAKGVPVEFIIVQVLRTILNTVVANSHRLTYNLAGLAENVVIRGASRVKEGAKNLLGCLPCSPMASPRANASPRQQ